MQKKSISKTIDPKILDKVKQIMQKDPKTWTKAQQTLMNNYVKLTQGFFDSENI